LSLRWKSLEKNLRARVRAEVRASEALRREYEQRRGLWRRHFNLPAWTIRPFLFFVIGVTMSNASAPVAQLVAFIWLWVLAAALLRAFQWNQALYLSPALNVFQHLPVSDARIFQTQTLAVLRKSLWSVADFALLYGMLLHRAGGGWNSVWYGAVLGLVQWLFVVALAAALFAWGPRRFVGLLMLPLGAAAISMFWIRQPALLNTINSFAHWIPPLGWLPQAAQNSYGSGLARHLPPTLVWAVVLAALPVAWRGVRAMYVLAETDFTTARQLTSPAEASASAQEHVVHFTAPPETVEAMVRSGSFMAGLDWQQAGPVERTFARLLNAREQVIAEYLCAGRPGWTRGFRNSLIFVAVGALIARLLIGRADFNLTFVVMMGLYFLVAHAAGHGRGFVTVSPAGSQPPGYAFYPVGFRELFITLLKINTARTALMVPLIMAGLFLLGGEFRALFDTSAWWRLLLLCFMAQPLLALTPISSASNDSSRWRFALPAIAYIILLLGVGVAFVMLPRPALALASGLVLLLLIVGGVWFYARRFNRSRFDLMPDVTARS
jgi:hypothetical protein